MEEARVFYEEKKVNKFSELFMPVDTDFNSIKNLLYHDKVFSLVTLAGFSGSGKNYFANLLETKSGYNRLRQVTTRPMRESEREGREYFFISPEMYKYLKPFLIGTTGFLGNQYGSFPSYSEGSINLIILNAEGQRNLQLKDVAFYSSIGLTAKRETLLERATGREGRVFQEKEDEFFLDTTKILVNDSCNVLTESSLKYNIDVNFHFNPNFNKSIEDYPKELEDRNSLVSLESDVTSVSFIDLQEARNIATEMSKEGGFLSTRNGRMLTGKSDVKASDTRIVDTYSKVANKYFNGSYFGIIQIESNPGSNESSSNDPFFKQVETALDEIYIDDPYTDFNFLENVYNKGGRFYYRRNLPFYPLLWSETGSYILALIAV